MTDFSSDSDISPPLSSYYRINDIDYDEGVWRLEWSLRRNALILPSEELRASLRDFVPIFRRAT